MIKQRAPQNRTMDCAEAEMKELAQNVINITSPVSLEEISSKIINGDIFDVSQYLPTKFVDLLILDPPYNLSKKYGGSRFNRLNDDSYSKWFDSFIACILPTLKDTATIYACSDWRTSLLIAPILAKHFHIRNRITWEREKGRGAKQNWKNNMEDIWFCTVTDNYLFNVDAVKLKRKVIAPYKANGKPKDWQQDRNGKYRLTYPSNIWSDITIPFWSMPENTDHPTQKSEKLMAKLILASSTEGDFVFDPFAGSGTTPVVCSKLGRKFCAVEIEKEYCCWTVKRLERVAEDSTIQGYTDGVFWERNTSSQQISPNLGSDKQKRMFS